MSIVKIKDKYQVTLPASLRKKVGLKVGDLLEASVERGTITLTPKSLVDRQLAEALKDVNEGRVYGPFESGDEMVRSLDANSRKLLKRKSEPSRE